MEQFKFIGRCEHCGCNHLTENCPPLPPREPKYMGSGIHVHQQFQAKDLVIGDTFWDADFGPMIWAGDKWVSDTAYARRLTEAAAQAVDASHMGQYECVHGTLHYDDEECDCEEDEDEDISPWDENNLP